MLRKHCFRSVLNAINRYNYFRQSLLSTTHQFSSTIQNTTDNSFTDKTDITHKIQTTFDRRGKRLRLYKTVFSDKNFDILTDQLIKTTSIPQLFELISSHHSIMNNRHIAEAFETINNLLNDSSFDKTQLLSSNEYQLLCKQTMNRIQYLANNELLSCIKAMVSLRVPLQTKIVYSLLLKARKSINDFSIHEIVFFDFLLEKMQLNNRSESSFNEISSIENQSQAILPLVDALKLALPLVMQAKIDTNEINYNDIELVIRSLHISCKHNIKEDIITKLLSALASKIDYLTNEQCFKIVEDLIRLPNKSELNTNHVDKLIRTCLDKATTITTSELLSLKLNCNYIVSFAHCVKNQRRFYHKGLYDLVADFIVEYPEKVDVWRACYVLDSCEYYDHVHYGLIDYISELIYNNKEFVNIQRISFMDILRAFALPANYHQNKPNSLAIYDAIIGGESVRNYRTQENKKYLLFKVLKYLCVLGYYPQDFIKDCVFNYLDEAVSNSTSFGLRNDILSNLIPLYQALNIDNNNDSNKSMIDKLKPYIDEYVSIVINENIKFDSTYTSVNKILSQGLGGQQFVVNGVFNEFGHYIDHVIVLRKGGYPVAIGNVENENISLIKDLSLPIDCKIIGVIVLTSRDYCRHPVIMKGVTDYRIKTMKKLGIIPVVINSEVFEALIEREKLPFVMREIQDVLQQSATQTNRF